MSNRWMKQGESVEAVVTDTDGNCQVSLNEKTFQLECTEYGDGQFSIQGSRRYKILAARAGSSVWVHVNGVTVEFKPVEAQSQAADDHQANPNAVLAPMPGTLIKLYVAAGDSVEKDQVVGILEAMKMEHNLRAPRAGKVKQLIGDSGMLVESGAAVVTLESLN